MPLHSAVGRRDPGDAAKTDPLFAELARLVLAGLAINAVGIDLAVMDTTRLLGKTVADIIAIRLDLPAQLHQSRPELRWRNRRHGVPGAAEARGHDRLFDRSVAALGAGDLARLPLRFEPVPVAKPSLELVAVNTTQREQDHRDKLLAPVFYTRRDGTRNYRRQ